MANSNNSLRKWRTLAAVKLNTLARLCGCSWHELARIEAGQVEPRAAIVARLVEVTGIPFDALLGARGRARLERFRAAAEPNAIGRGGRPRVEHRPWPRATARDALSDPDVKAIAAELGRR